MFQEVRPFVLISIAVGSRIVKSRTTMETSHVPTKKKVKRQVTADMDLSLHLLFMALSLPLGKRLSTVLCKYNNIRDIWTAIVRKNKRYLRGNVVG